MSVINNFFGNLKKLLCVTVVLSFFVSMFLPSLTQASDYNVPHFGAELPLFEGANVTRNQNNFSDPVTGDPGDNIAGLIYIHNDVLGSEATNSKVKVDLPSTTTNKTAVLKETLSASNAEPKWISDTLTMNLSADANLSYVPGSAKFYHVEDNQSVEKPFPNHDGDNLTTVGVNLGNLKGCKEFIYYISFIVKTKAKEVPKQPNLHVSKLVRDVSTNEANFVQSNQAFAGDVLEYKINFSNTGDVAAYNVLLKDVIPPHTKYVAGSAVISRNGGPEQKISDDLVGGGITLDKIDPRENSYVKFRVTIDSDAPKDCVLVNTVILDGVSATAQTTIVKVITPVTVKPEAPKPLPTTGPVETASVIFASILMGVYGFIRYRKHLAKEETKIISQLLSE